MKGQKQSRTDLLEKKIENKDQKIEELERKINNIISTPKNDYNKKIEALW